MTTEETAYGAFARRSDDTTPDMCKLMEDRFFFDLHECAGFASHLAQQLDCEMDVRELRITVGDVVTTKGDAT